MFLLCHEWVLPLLSILEVVEIDLVDETFLSLIYSILIVELAVHLVRLVEDLLLNGPIGLMGLLLWGPGS